MVKATGFTVEKDKVGKTPKTSHFRLDSGAYFLLSELFDGMKNLD